LGGGFGWGGGGNFKLIDMTTGECVASAHLTFANSELYETDIDANCNANVNLLPGEYKLKVTKDGCNEATLEVSLAEGSNEVDVSLACGNTQDQVSLCFSPGSGLGIVKAKAYRLGVYNSTISNCGTNKCDFFVESGLTYKFETSNGYYSDVEYPANALKAYGESASCITLLSGGVSPNLPAGKGQVIVKVKDGMGNLVPGAMVRLVNPDDINGEISSQRTGYNGSSLGVAFFDEKLGTLFKVKVEASENTSAYFGNTVYNVTEEPLTITISLSASVTSHLTVLDKSTNLGITGVLFTLFEQPSEQNKTYTYSGTEGKANIGLRSGYSYRVALWKQGYKYVEGTLDAGADKTFYMEKIAENQVGAVDAIVYFKDSGLGVEGATATLVKDGVPTGYYAPKTNPDGQTAFEGVMPGDYCVEISRTKGVASACSDNPVTVVADDRALVEIPISEYTYRLDVIVKKQDGSGVKDASVKVTDSFAAFSFSNKTNAVGRASFSVPETNTNVLVQVLYKDANGEVYDVGQAVGKITERKETTIYLVPSGNTIVYLEAEDLNGNELDLSNVTLRAGNTYNFLFSLGLFDIQGNKPEMVKFTVQDTKGYVEFIPTSQYEWLTTSSSSPSTTLDYLAQGDYDSNTRKQIAVPVRVKQVFSGEKYHNFTYKGYWKNGTIEINDPATGFYKSPSFTMQAGYCSKYGDSSVVLFGVCKYILSGGAQLKPDPSVTVNLLDNVTMGIEVTNEGSSTYSGGIVIEDTLLNLFFASQAQGSTTELKIKKGATETALPRSQYTLDVHKLTISNLALDHGDTLKILLVAQAVSPPQTLISSFAGTQGLGNMTFTILGQATPILKSMTPSVLYDLTNRLEFSFKEEESGVDIQKWRILQGRAYLNGDGLSCKMDLNDPREMHMTNRDPNNPLFQIDFDGACRIQQNGKVNLSISGNLANLKPRDWIKTAQPCLTFPQPIVIFAQPQVDCQVDFVYAPDEAQRVEQPTDGGATTFCTRQTPVTVYVRTCDSGVNVKNFDAIDVDNNVASALASGKSIIFYYFKRLTGADTGETIVKTSVGATVQATNGVLSSTYKLPMMDFYVQNPPSTQATGAFFIAKDIQKYGEALDCRQRFCNIEQVLNYIKEQTNDFATIPYSTNFKMVDQKITPQDIENVWRAAGLPNDVVTGTDQYEGSIRYVIDVNDFHVPKKGDDAVVLKTYTDGKGNDHVFISFSNIPDTSGTYSKADYMQLYILNQDNFAGIKKLKAEINVDKSVISKSDQVQTALENLVNNSWNLTYSTVTGTQHILQGEICDTSLTSMSSICMKLNSTTGDYHIAAIYSEVLTDGKVVVHFVATDADKLLALINALDDAVKNPGTGSGLAVGRDGQYLRTAPKELRFDCIYGADKCSTQLTPELNDSLKAFGAKMIGGSTIAADIELVYTDQTPQMAVVICPNLADCRQPAPQYIEDPVNSKGFKPHWGAKADVPDGGILWSESGNVLPQFYAFGGTLQTITKLLDSYGNSGAWPGYAKFDYATAGYREMTMSKLNELLASNGTAIKSGDTGVINATVVKITSADCRIGLSDLNGKIVDKDGKETALYGGQTYFLTLKPDDTPGVSSFVVYANSLTTADPEASLPALRCVSPLQLAPRPLDMVFLGRTSDLGTFLDIYSYSSFKDGDSLDDAALSTIRTRLSLPSHNEYEVKVADIDGDKNSEIILFSKSSGMLSVLYKNGEDSNGNIIDGNKLNTTAGPQDWKGRVKKTIQFDTGLGFVDFAVLPWKNAKGAEVPAIAMLRNNGGNNDVFVYEYATIPSTVNKDYTPQTELDINDDNFNMLKAVDIDGKISLLTAYLTALETTVVAMYPVTDKNAPIGSEYNQWSGDDNRSKYFKLKSSDIRGCADINVGDWNKEGKKELACLYYGGCPNNRNINDIFLFDIAAMQNNKDVINLDESTVSYKTWINSADTQADNIKLADIDGSGTDVLIQSDLIGGHGGYCQPENPSFVTYKDKVNLLLGQNYGDGDKVTTDLKDKDITIKLRSTYQDVAVYDWLNSWGPKIA